MLPRPSRPALLFLAALGAPCVLVIGLTLRLLAQERELAEKRLADDRRRQATNVRQDLIGLLARRRADRLEGKSTVNGGDAWPVAFLARVDGDALLFPWDEGSAKGSDPPAFIIAIASGERAEFAQRSYADAATSYAAAVADAATPAQRSTAQLHLARVLEKDGKTDRARSLYVTLAETPADAVDDQGIPLALYAARRLVESQDLSIDTAEGHRVLRWRWQRESGA